MATYSAWSAHGESRATIQRHIDTGLSSLGIGKVTVRMISILPSQSVTL